MSENKKPNKFLLEVIKKACLEDRLDCDDLINLGLELRLIRVKEQRKIINEVYNQLYRSMTI